MPGKYNRYEGIYKGAMSIKYFDTKLKAVMAANYLKRKRKSLTSKNIGVVKTHIAHQPAWKVVATSKKALDIGRNTLRKKRRKK